MFNPPNSFPGAGSYDEILKRLTRRVQQKQADQQILVLLQNVFETELGEENAVLSRPERVRLFQQVTRTILNDVIGKIDHTK